MSLKIEEWMVKVTTLGPQWVDLKDRIDLLSVVKSEIGDPDRERNGRYLWCCPFHEDGTPSFNIKKNSDHWKCYGCSRGGDVVDFIRERHGLDFPGAMAWFADHLGEGGKEGRKTEKPKPKPKAPKKSQDEPIGMRPEKAWELVGNAEKTLWSPKGEAALDYLRGRGLTDETIRRHRLGWLPRCTGAAWNPPGIIIPWQERGGRLSLVKVRPDDDWRLAIAEKNRPPKYIQAFAHRPSLYVAKPIVPGRPLIVTEGELDCILVGQQLEGVECGVVTLGGASGQIEPVLAGLLAATPWLIAADADQAGDETADRWEKLAKPRCRRIRPPSKDWTDTHAGGCNGVRYYFGRELGQSMTWAELEAQRWGPALLDEDDPALDAEEPDDVMMHEEPLDAEELLTPTHASAHPCVGWMFDGSMAEPLFWHPGLEPVMNFSRAGLVV